jgi:hypothetical protein
MHLAFIWGCHGLIKQGLLRGGDEQVKDIIRRCKYVACPYEEELFCSKNCTFLMASHWTVDEQSNCKGPGCCYIQHIDECPRGNEAWRLTEQ